MAATSHRWASAGPASTDLFDAPYFARYVSEFHVVFGDKIRAAFGQIYSGAQKQKLGPEARACHCVFRSAMSPFVVLVISVRALA